MINFSLNTKKCVKKRTYKEMTTGVSVKDEEDFKGGDKFNHKNMGMGVGMDMATIPMDMFKATL